MTTIKIEEGAKCVEAHPGERITVEVPGTNTTGYLWQLQTNPDAVQVVGHEVVPDEEHFGGAGVERFVIESIKEGNATLHLELKAPWESDPAETYDLEVHSVPQK